MWGVQHREIWAARMHDTVQHTVRETLTQKDEMKSETGRGSLRAKLETGRSLHGSLHMWFLSGLLIFSLRERWVVGGLVAHTPKSHRSGRLNREHHKLEPSLHNSANEQDLVSE